MDGKKRTLLILVLIIVLVAGTVYFYPESSKNNSFTSLLDGNEDVLYSDDVLRMNDLQTNQEYSFTLKRGDTVILNSEFFDSTIRLINLNKEYNVLVLSVGGVGEQVLNSGKQVKLNLNSDDYFDLLISIKEIRDLEADLFFMPIHEKMGVFDNVQLQLNKVAEKVEGRSKLQSIIIFSIFLILLILVVSFVLKVYVLPILKLKKIKARKGGNEVFEELFEELKGAYKVGDKAKAQKLANKMKHLYEYLSAEEKKKINIRGIEKYIN